MNQSRPPCPDEDARVAAQETLIRQGRASAAEIAAFEAWLRAEGQRRAAVIRARRIVRPQYVYDEEEL